MGLDAVEIVLRTEETFAIDLPDSECARIITVGDLYRLVLEKLNLPYVPVSEIESRGNGHDRSRIRLSSIVPWTTSDVWVTLKALIQDQLQVDMDDIRESASFIHDLGCD
jgi:acyl carrier protein